MSVPALWPEDSDEGTPAEGAFDITRALRIGGGLFALLLLLAIVVPIGGAVLGQGQVGVESRVKRIAHPFGGVIAEILVANGEHVKEGQLLMRLDDKVTGADATYASLSVEQLLAQRAPADAMSKAEEALKVNANCAAAHALLADIYKSMNQRILTIEALQTAARLAPDDPTHFYRLGNLQAGLGATDEAIQAYTQVVAADPTWWRPYAGRATLRYRQRDPQAALADLHEASAWAPREPSIYENRAVVLQALGRSEEAERDRASAKTLATGGVL